MPQTGLESLQPKGQAGARVESSSEGASPQPGAVEVGKVQPSPEESQHMKSPQKELEQPKLLKQRRIALR